MNINKFGGASLKDAKRIENVVEIVKTQIKSPSVIVVSAIGKTTNALEKVHKAYVEGNSQGAFEILGQIKNDHYKLCQELFSEKELEKIIHDLNDTFVEIEWILEEELSDGPNFIYDQIISIGELVSSKILAARLNQETVTATWLDARDVIRTDNTYRNASIEWKETKDLVNQFIPNICGQSDFCVTQGFIGGTSENFTTTLGREGSDFTAAILANSLKANGVTVWKDVPGVMNADPNLMKDAQLLKNISYNEALAMTYYGAKVIHPKTIKPLMQSSIPLRVKSFVNPEAEGTYVGALESELKYPSILVQEPNNILLKITSKDNSFIRERHLAEIFTLMNESGLVLKLDQNKPEYLTLCVGDPYSNIEKFDQNASANFNVEITKPVDLITIRHGVEIDILKHLTGRNVLHLVKTQDTTRFVVT